jgi:tetratricopeptide (TPR) repeat protein
MESPSEGDIANYRSWRRKLRRRFPFPVFLIGISSLSFVAFLIRDAAILTLLWREHERFASLVAYAWWIAVLSSFFHTLLYLVFNCIYAWGRQQNAVSRKSGAAQKLVSVYSRLTGFIVPGLVMVALLANQIDIAIVAFFISNAVSRFSKAVRFKQRMYAVHGLFSMVTAGAVVASPAIISTLLCAIDMALSLFRWPSLREFLHKKPTRRKYVQRAYEYQPPYPHLTPMRLFSVLCEAQMWDEALAELEREKNRKHRKTILRWHHSRAYLGAERFDDVIALNQSTDPADSPFAVFLAVAYAKLGEHELALSVAHAAVRSDDERAVLCMAEVYSEIGDLPRALWWYEIAISDYMNEGLRGAGKTLMDLNDPAEAKYPLWYAVQMCSWLKADDLMQLAQCYRQLGKKRAAAEAEQIAQEQMALEQLPVEPSTSTHTAVPA